MYQMCTTITCTEHANIVIIIFVIFSEIMAFVGIVL